MKCCIVRDLLSNYIDGQNCEKTNEEIRKHLETCALCRRDYEKMSASIPLEQMPKAKSIDFFRKLRMTLLRKNILLVLFLSFVILGFCIFAKNCYVTLPFDPEHMSVEVFRAAVVPEENGTMAWTQLDDLDFAQTQDFVTGNLNEIRLAEIVYEEIPHISQTDHNARTICQEGEEVRIVYYCYRKTLWDSLFFIGSLAGYSESGAAYGSFLYGENYERPDYEPQEIEVYYLAKKDLEKLDALSDEEFAALRAKAHLVWRDII